MKVGFRLNIWFVLALAVLFGPVMLFAEPSEKNFEFQAPPATGSTSKEAPSNPLNAYNIGDRVRAEVDYPSKSDCILSGYLGTIVCYDSSDPETPYLVDWDNDCGLPQSQICGNTAQHGWWVGFSDVKLVNDAISGGDCAIFDPATNVLTISDVKVPANDLSGGETHWKVDLQLIPQAIPFQPVRFKIKDIKQIP